MNIIQSSNNIITDVNSFMYLIFKGILLIENTLLYHQECVQFKQSVYLLTVDLLNQ